MRNHMTRLIVAAICPLFGAGASHSSADVLVQYDFQTQSLSPSDSDANVVTNPLVQTFAATQGSGASNWTFRGSFYLGVQVQTTPSALDTNEYFEVTVAPAPGYTLDLSTLTFNGRYENSAVLPVNYWVRSDADGDNFATNLATTDPTPSSNPALSLSSDGQLATIDLSGSAFQDLSSAVTFRIYMADNSASNSDTRWSGIDNITLNGSSTIPEPASLALAGAGLMLIAGRRWRV